MKKILNEAINKVESEVNLDEEIAIILHKEDWHIGVIGIVASRLVEKFYRPSILLTNVDGIVKGSARSIADFNLYEALKECEDVLLQFGGHKAAAGLSIHYDKINEFKKRFNEVAKRTLTPEQLIPTLEIEAVVELNSITPKFRRILEKFAPFGPQNMKPIFMTEGVEIFDRPRVSANNHLFMKVRKNNSAVFDVVGYNMGDYAQNLLDLNGSIKNTYIDIAYTIESTTINDMIFPQLNLKDFRLSQK